MPLTSIRLREFKCFRDSGPIAIAPLTIVFGRNNAGKSSILESLLLLRQTMHNPDYGPRLHLGGDLYRAGSFADIVNDHKASKRIGLSFGIDDEEDMAPGSISMQFAADEPRQPQMVSMLIKSTTKSFPPVEIRRGVGRGGPYELFLDNDGQGGEKDREFFFPPNSFLPHIFQRTLDREEVRKSPPDLARRSAARLLARFDTILRSIVTMGPFRRQPERRYEYLGPVSDAIGMSGEHIIDTLIEDSLRRGRKQRSLLEAANVYLKAMGRVRIMPIRRITKKAKLFELRVKETSTGKWANYADVGFGIGQALPVIVAGLRTRPQALFMVQEPEIHLHPDAQLAMADFLIDLALSGRHVIAETHSENLLLRVRHRLIDSASTKTYKTGLAPDDVSIVYVERRKDGTSVAAPITIDDLGQVGNWPRDFMQEASKERMAIMRSMAKTKRKAG